MPLNLNHWSDDGTPTPRRNPLFTLTYLIGKDELTETYDRKTVAGGPTPEKRYPSVNRMVKTRKGLEYVSLTTSLPRGTTF